EMGADETATDIFGATALQRLLASICYEDDIKIYYQDFIHVYDILAQRPLKFKYGDRAITVMPHKAEYFLINFFMGAFTHLYVLGKNYITSQYLEAQFRSVPESILPPWRKTRQYWNGILS